MSFEIVTDSCANLPDEWIHRYGIHILSLIFRVEDEEFESYREDEVNDLTQFYRLMREKKEITTSLVNVEKTQVLLEKLLKEGKDVMYIGFSSGLSGSFQAVSMVVEELQQQYPSQTILAIDSLSAALGEGLLVYYAAEHRNEGKSIIEVQQWIFQHRLHLCHWFTVDDLFFLQRGGRVSQTTAIVGSILCIKPVMHVDNEGKLIMVEKARGRKKSLEALVHKMKETVSLEEHPIAFISHGDCKKDAEYVAMLVKEQLGINNILIHTLDPVIGAHSGPGTVALFFLGDHR